MCPSPRCLLASKPPPMAQKWRRVLLRQARAFRCHDAAARFVWSFHRRCPEKSLDRLWTISCAVILLGNCQLAIKNIMGTPKAFPRHCLTDRLAVGTAEGLA